MTVQVRKEVVTVVVQKVVNDTVIAVNVHRLKRVVYRRRDGSEYILFQRRECNLIKGVALI